MIAHTIGPRHHAKSSHLSMDEKSLRYESLLILLGHSRDKIFFSRTAVSCSKKTWKAPISCLNSVKRIRALCQLLAWDNASLFILVEIRDPSAVILSKMSPFGLIARKQWLGWKISKNASQWLVGGGWSQTCHVSHHSSRLLMFNNRHQFPCVINGTMSWDTSQTSSLNVTEDIKPGRNIL